MFLQKFVYQLLLGGFPKLVYNPFLKNPFNAKFVVDKNSLYINYALNNEAVSNLEKYIDNEDLVLEPISIQKNRAKKHFISINIYNVTSPILNTINTVTRCEINTYVKRKSDKKIGTLILDYTSNSLSMDPVNIFKPRSFTTHFLNNTNNIDINAKSIDFTLHSKINITDANNIFKTNKELHQFTDNIFYKNGIYDKIYYDSSLTHSNTLEIKDSKIHFKFNGIEYNNPDSVFYFNSSIFFSGEMWYNIFDY